MRWMRGRHSPRCASRERVQIVISGLIRICNSGESRELRARDGSIKHVVIDSSGRFEDGGFVHSRCLTREIGALGLAERAGRERDDRYQALVKALPALIVTLTPSGEFEDISESYRQYTGLTL